MGAFDQNSAALAAEIGEKNWLDSFRQRSLASWSRAELPHARTESWKYTSLAPLTDGDYLRFGQLDETAIDPSSYLLDGIEGPRVVFINGQFSPAHSSLTATPEGVALARFSDATPTQRAVIERHLGQIAPREHAFAALNGSWLEDGLFYHVSASTARPEPLHVVHLTAASGSPFSAAQRLLVVLDTGCEATVIEHFASGDGQQNSFLSSASEFLLHDNARLTHYRLHLEEEHSIHIGGAYAQLKRDSRLESFCLTLGGRLKRLDLRVQHQGAGSECQLNGVYLCRGKQHADIHSTVEHESPQGTTSEIFRGIVDDEARAVFNGRIHIHPQAQKTQADLSNRNLLLTNRAEIYTKPELEIYADDVRCSHGATVSQIEDDALYYLQSRGIDRREAEVLLSFGFINELLDQLPHAALRQRLRPVLSHWFDRNSLLTRHLL